MTHYYKKEKGNVKVDFKTKEPQETSFSFVYYVVPCKLSTFTNMIITLIKGCTDYISLNKVYLTQILGRDFYFTLEIQQGWMEEENRPKILEKQKLYSYNITDIK